MKASEMSVILNYMLKNHGLCDELFSVAEQAVAENNWTDAGPAFVEFVLTCEKHFAKEEQVLFPQIERANGHPGGPTQVMRMEHQQMRGLFDDLSQLIQDEERDEFLGGAETLLILMQQHNMKEEQILYPMADNVLSHDCDMVITAMEQLQ